MNFPIDKRKVFGESDCEIEEVRELAAALDFGWISRDSADILNSFVRDSQPLIKETLDAICAKFGEAAFLALSVTNKAIETGVGVGESPGMLALAVLADDAADSVPVVNEAHVRRRTGSKVITSQMQAGETGKSCKFWIESLVKRIQTYSVLEPGEEGNNGNLLWQSHRLLWECYENALEQENSAAIYGYHYDCGGPNPFDLLFAVPIEELRQACTNAVNAFSTAVSSEASLLKSENMLQDAGSAGQRILVSVLHKSRKPAMSALAKEVRYLLKSQLQRVISFLWEDDVQRKLVPKLRSTIKANVHHGECHDRGILSIDDAIELHAREALLQAADNMIQEYLDAPIDANKISLNDRISALEMHIIDHPLQTTQSVSIPYTRVVSELPPVKVEVIVGSKERGEQEKQEEKQE